MLRQGDIVEIAEPRIGFVRPEAVRLALIVQRDPANGSLSTTVVVPIDEAPAAGRHPFDVVIPAPETGTASPAVAYVDRMQSVWQEALGAVRGRAGPATLRRVRKALRMLLG